AKARLILNLDGGDEISFAVAFEKLQESLQPAQRADDCRSTKDSLLVRDFKRVRLILIHRKHGIARPLCFDYERRRAQIIHKPAPKLHHCAPFESPDGAL